LAFLTPKDLEALALPTDADDLKAAKPWLGVGPLRGPKSNLSKLRQHCVAAN
jgi:hypothetical protein